MGGIYFSMGDCPYKTCIELQHRLEWGRDRVEDKWIMERSIRSAAKVIQEREAQSWLEPGGTFHDAVKRACLICERPLPKYKVKFWCPCAYCRMRGEPAKPPLCSNACMLALLLDSALTYSKRRELAGIAKWSSNEGSEISFNLP